MSTIEAKKRELKDIEAIGNITGVLRDISISRIRDMRERFVESEEFYRRIGPLYTRIKEFIGQYHGGLAAELRKRPAVNIAVTSNSRFYGGLNREVIDLFLRDWDKAEEHIVIGRTGEGYMVNTARYEECRFHHFVEDNPDRLELQKFIALTEVYSQAVMYYPKYRNTFAQEPATFDITQAPSMEFSEKLDDYIIEPDLPVLHNFFSTQVKWILIERVMMETDLSRTAARLVRMNAAESSAAEMLEQVKKELRRAQHQILDAQLFESLAGFGE